jgi:hypothetical protein
LRFKEVKDTVFGYMSVNFELKSSSFEMLFWGPCKDTLKVSNIYKENIQILSTTSQPWISRGQFFSELWQEFNPELNSR